MESIYPSNDVTVILTLDGNKKIYVEEEQLNKDESPNPKRQIIYKCGHEYKFRVTGMRLTLETENILNKWYSQNFHKLSHCHYPNKDDAGLLSEQTGISVSSVKRYMKYRQEQKIKCTFTSEDFIELLQHQNEEHSGEFLIEEEASSDGKKPNQEEELQVRLGQSWHLKK